MPKTTPVSRTATTKPRYDVSNAHVRSSPPIRIIASASPRRLPASLDHPVKGNVLYRQGMRYDEAESAGPLARFADKYPFNFISSRIFHDVPFGYHLCELGRCQRAYDALITHWWRVLHAGVMIEIEQEELVDDSEANVRRMHAHCGVE